MIINVPDELKQLNQWVGWQIEKDEKGNPTKVPYFSRTQKKASTTNPDDWSGFLFTLEAVKKGFHEGIGFVFTEGDPYCFIDLDKCVDKKTDVIESWALNIIEKLQSYTERSQSYTDPEKEKYGIHIIVKAKLPEWSRNRKGNFEIYDSVRYACMTGNVLKGYPVAIEERQEQVNQICSEIFKKTEPEQKPSRQEPSTITLSDQEILTRAKNDDKFNRLMAGDYSGYPSQSEADLALCCKIAFYSQGNYEQIDCMFRTSGLMRDKWERADYRNDTINKALELTTEYYSKGSQTNQQVKAEPVEPEAKDNPEPETKSKNQKTSEFDKHKEQVNAILSKHDLNTTEIKKSALRESESYIKSITNPNITGGLWNIVNKELNLTDVERDIELTFKSAKELGKMEIPEINWIVPGIIPEGLTLLCGKPKTGKSWLALGLSVAIASGGRAFGSIPMEEFQGKVLYLALEDNNRRMKKRLTKLCIGSELPENLIYTTEIKRGIEGIKIIKAWLNKEPEARLVVIDTFVSFRGKAKGNINEYDRDSNDMQFIQQLAGDFGIGIILIHHLRKAIAEDDFDTISGTLGLTGKADTNLILKRTRGEADAVLKGTGRDLDEDIDLALKFDTSIATWVILSRNASDYRVTLEQQEIARLLARQKDGLTISEIANRIGSKQENVRQMLYRMNRNGVVVCLRRRYYLKEDIS